MLAHRAPRRSNPRRGVVQRRPASQALPPPASPRPCHHSACTPMGGSWSPIGLAAPRASMHRRQPFVGPSVRRIPSNGPAWKPASISSAASRGTPMSFPLTTRGYIFSSCLHPLSPPPALALAPFLFASSRLLPPCVSRTHSPCPSLSFSHPLATLRACTSCMEVSIRGRLPFFCHNGVTRFFPFPSFLSFYFRVMDTRVRATMETSNV